MIELADQSNASVNGDNSQEETWLLGQPSLWEYLEFVKDSVVGGADVDQRAATAEWREANSYYQRLEDSESGIADTAECHALSADLSSLADEVVAHSTYRKVYDTMPAEFGMVELDKLVLCQKSVTSTFVNALAKRLGENPAAEALFRFCLPLEKPNVTVQARAMGSKRFVFRADSTDFRFHQAALLRPDQLNDFASFGPVSGAVGLVVGFGSNFLNVIKVGNRLLLHNGYHRACALRSLGVTYAPCIIQAVATQDELEVTAKDTVTKNPDFYFKSVRPPLLKDYFDPAIRKVLPVHKHVRIVEVNFEVKEYLVPE